MIFETNFEIVTKLFDDFEKNAILQRNNDFKYFDFFFYEIRFTNDFNLFKRLNKQCKKFQKIIIIFNNVLSFINENAKMNKLYNV